MRYPKVPLDHYFLPMSETIAPGEKRWVIVRPQIIFRATGLAYVGPPNNFVLHDIKVGKNSQFAGCSYYRETGVPMEMFQPIPELLTAAVDKLVKIADKISEKKGTLGAVSKEVDEIVVEAADDVLRLTNNLGKVDTCHIAMDWKLLVENVATGYTREPATTEFKCIVKGFTVGDNYPHVS
jgi:hypothetical protein